jgi:hypothetical protein
MTSALHGKTADEHLYQRLFQASLRALRWQLPAPGTVSVTTSASSASTGFIGLSLSRLTSAFDDQIHY